MKKRRASTSIRRGRSSNVWLRQGRDVFSFVMAIEGCSFPEAVKSVAEKCGVPLPVIEYSREAEERDRQRDELRTLNQWATEFFRE